jgi:hypothetical protein
MSFQKLFVPLAHTASYQKQATAPAKPVETMWRCVSPLRSVAAASSNVASRASAFVTVSRPSTAGVSPAVGGAVGCRCFSASCSGRAPASSSFAERLAEVKADRARVNPAEATGHVDVNTKLLPWVLVVGALLWGVTERSTRVRVEKRAVELELQLRDAQHGVASPSI